MNDFKSIVSGIILLILIASGLFSFLLEFTGEFIKLNLWLFQLSFTDFGLLPLVEVIIKLLTFVMSYALVGIIFNALEFFESNFMRYAYFAISTLVGFALSAVIMFLQEHIILISWSILGISMFSIISIVLIIKKRNTIKE